jgi:hypothetical protein
MARRSEESKAQDWIGIGFVAVTSGGFYAVMEGIWPGLLVAAVLLLGYYWGRRDERGPTL